MKKNAIAYYNAYGGVYQERRLKKSAQFVIGAYVLVIGLGVVLISQGLSLTGNRTAVAAAPAPARLVAHTDPTPIEPSLPAAVNAPVTPISNVSAETSRISDAVQTVISKPPAATWSVAIYDIDANQWLYRNNSTDQMSSASLYKLYAVYGLSKKVPFSQWATTKVAGKDLQTCVDLMIRVSDNTCGNAIGSYVGWTAIDSAVHTAGFSGTTLNLKAGPITTAEDTTRFMTQLYTGKLFDADTTAFLKNSLLHQLYRSAIPAGCSGCTVYNKTGNESGVAHDSAIVVSGGHTYAVTIMSQGGSYYKISTVEAAIQTALASTTP